MNRQRLEAKIEDPEFRRELFRTIFGDRAPECLKRYEAATRRGLARNWPVAGLRFEGCSYRIYAFSTNGNLPAGIQKELEHEIEKWTLLEVIRRANQPPVRFSGEVFCGVMAAPGAREPEAPYTLYLEDAHGPSGLPLASGDSADEPKAGEEPGLVRLFGKQSMEEVAARQAALAQQLPLNSEGDLMTQQQLSMAQQLIQQQLTGPEPEKPDRNR